MDTIDFEKPIEFRDWKETFIFDTNADREEAIRLMERAEIKYCVPKVSSELLNIPYFLQVKNEHMAERCLRIFKRKFSFGERMINVAWLPEGPAFGHGYPCHALKPREAEAQVAPKRKRQRVSVPIR